LVLVNQRLADETYSGLHWDFEPKNSQKKIIKATIGGGIFLS
jgi:hypothetical protein